jgi:hypothetical protein
MLALDWRQKREAARMGWVRAPRQFPRKCFHSNQSEADHGPYWEAPDARFERWDGEAQVRREYVPYLSRTALRGILNEPGSPFACITHDELIAKEARIEELEAELFGLESQLDEYRLAAEVEAEASPASPIDVAALARAMREEDRRLAAEEAAARRAERSARRAARTGG